MKSSIKVTGQGRVRVTITTFGIPTNPTVRRGVRPAVGASRRDSSPPASAVCPVAIERGTQTLLKRRTALDAMRAFFVFLLAAALGGAGAVAGDEDLLVEAPAGLGSGAGACGLPLRLAPTVDEERGEVRFLIEEGPSLDASKATYALARPGEAPFSTGAVGDARVAASSATLEPGTVLSVRAGLPVSFTLLHEGDAIATSGMCI